MKVLVVTTWLPTSARPEVGAFVVRDIEMLRRDHEVAVIHLSADGGAADVPFPVHTIRMSPADPRSIRNAGRVIARHAGSADLVHSMAASALLPFRALRLTAPWVHTEHWSALLAPRTAPLASRLAIPLTFRLLRRPDVVVAVGHDLAARIDSRRRGPTVVIPNEVHRPDVLRERPRTSVTTLVGVGGLIARKGPDIAIQALAELVSRGMDARLVWAGDGPLRDELTMLAERLGVADRVELRGRILPEDVADVLAEGDVFILPTAMETFGVAIAEALVSGRPVVTSNEGEQSSFVSEPDGALVAERSADAYADAVQRVLALNENRSAGEIAARASRLFDPENRRAATRAAYDAAATGAGERLPRDVEVIVAAHDARRDIERAVSSALTSRSVHRVRVICHNVDADDIRAATGAVADDPRVEFHELRDGVRSPAGPFNAGLDHAECRYVAVLGSDDEVTSGAIDGWRSTARETGADMVIAPLRHAGGRRVPTPPTPRRRKLRGARDRLAYRTAPLGLISRPRFGDLRFTPELATGEDLAFTTRMWFSGARIARHVGPGEYLIHDDAERVTFTSRPLADELRAVELLLADSGTRALAPGDRLALAVKLWRLPIFGAIHYRAGAWAPEDLPALRRIAAELQAFSRPAIRTLSRADAALITAIADSTTTTAQLDALSRRRRRFFRIAALMPSDPRRLLAREAPLRFSAATWWALRS